MYHVLTEAGIMSLTLDTGIEDLAAAKARARVYYAQGHDAEVRDEDSEESMLLLTHDDDEPDVMTVWHDGATLAIIAEAALDNNKLDPAYITYAYSATEQDADGLRPAYSLIWYTYGVNSPDEIDWTAPDEIIPAGMYDPDTGRII